MHFALFLKASLHGAAVLYVLRSTGDTCTELLFHFGLRAPWIHDKFTSPNLPQGRRGYVKEEDEEKRTPGLLLLL